MQILKLDLNQSARISELKATVEKSITFTDKYHSHFPLYKKITPLNTTTQKIRNGLILYWSNLAEKSSKRKINEGGACRLIRNDVSVNRHINFQSVFFHFFSQYTIYIYFVYDVVQLELSALRCCWSIKFFSTS